MTAQAIPQTVRSRQRDSEGSMHHCDLRRYDVPQLLAEELRLRRHFWADARQPRAIAERLAAVEALLRRGGGVE